jgi:platelet-activating factor acetylhydrolase
MEAFASPGPKPVLDRCEGENEKDSAPQLLVLNSEAFTFFDSHFSALKDAISAFAPSRIMTIVGARHMSFSDIPAILPRAVLSTDERQVLKVICLIAEAFLRRQVNLSGSATDIHIPGVMVRSPEMRWEGSGKEKTKRLVGDDGDVVVH